MRHANVAGGVTQPFPQQPRGQAEVVVLDQGESARRGRLPAPRAPRQGLFGQRIGERLVIGQVGLPVAPELTAEQGLVRGVEQHVVNKPQDRVGHVVVRPVEGVPRDVEHPHGNIAGDPGALAAQGGRQAGRVPGAGAHWCAAARSASVNAAQIQITSACAATAATPGVIPLIRPPPPRRAISVPSAPNQ